MPGAKFLRLRLPWWTVKDRSCKTAKLVKRPVIDRTRRFAAMKKLERSRPPDPDPAVAKALTAVLLEDGDSTMCSTAGSCWRTGAGRRASPRQEGPQGSRVLRSENVQKAIDAIELRYQAELAGIADAVARNDPAFQRGQGRSVPSSAAARRIHELPSAGGSGIAPGRPQIGRSRPALSARQRGSCEPNRTSPYPAVAKALAGVLADGDNVVMRINAAHALVRQTRRTRARLRRDRRARGCAGFETWVVLTSDGSQARCAHPG